MAACPTNFSGLSLGPPLGDQRLDLCDLYAVAAPSDPSRTVLILNANPNADALHPDAIYRLAIDNDGDLSDDIAFSYVCSPSRRTVGRPPTSSWRGARRRDRPKRSTTSSSPAWRCRSAGNHQVGRI